MKIELRKASDRNTQAHWVSIGYVDILFSYETAIALNAPGIRCRKENHWGPTTGRHFKDAYAHDYPIVSDEEFEQRVQQALREEIERNQLL